MNPLAVEKKWKMSIKVSGPVDFYTYTKNVYEIVNKRESLSL
jgi:hypothetical protein